MSKEELRFGRVKIQRRGNSTTPSHIHLLLRGSMFEIAVEEEDDEAIPGDLGKHRRGILCENYLQNIIRKPEEDNVFRKDMISKSVSPASTFEEQIWE